MRIPGRGSTRPTTSTKSPFHILLQICVSDCWLPYLFQEMVPWMIFFTRSWSLFWCFHSFRSWKVCSCELCLRFILSTLSVFTFVPGKLSTRTLSQFGVNLVGTANLKKASSHRVTSAGMWKTTEFTEHFNFPQSFRQNNKQSKTNHKMSTRVEFSLRQHAKTGRLKKTTFYWLLLVEETNWTCVLSNILLFSFSFFWGKE